MPECHSGRLGSTPGGRTKTCRSGDQRCLQNGGNAVRFRDTSPRSHCWTALRLLSAGGQARLLLRALRSVLLAARHPDSQSGNAGSSPARNATSLPRDRSRGYEPRKEGSTPSRDATLSPADSGGDAPNVARRSSTLREGTSEHGAMVAHYFHTVGIGRFEYGARFHSRRRRATGALS